MFSKEIFCKRFKELRLNLGASQLQLAAALGISKSAISLIESGERAVSVEVLVLACDYFNVPADYLLGRTDSY